MAPRPTSGALGPAGGLCGAGFRSVRLSLGPASRGRGDKGKNTFDTTPKDSTTKYVEVPLQIGISVPVNSFRTCLFSIMGGGYGKYMWTEMQGGTDNKTKDAWDYGLRLSAIMEFSKFIIGAELSSSLNKKGMFYGVSLGYNLGRSNKKK